MFGFVGLFVCQAKSRKAPAKKKAGGAGAGAGAGAADNIDVRALAAAGKVQHEQTRSTLVGLPHHVHKIHAPCCALIFAS